MLHCFVAIQVQSRMYRDFTWAEFHTPCSLSVYRIQPGIKTVHPLYLDLDINFFCYENQINLLPIIQSRVYYVTFKISHLCIECIVMSHLIIATSDLKHWDITLFTSRSSWVYRKYTQLISQSNLVLLASLETMSNVSVHISCIQCNQIINEIINDAWLLLNYHGSSCILLMFSIWL